MTSQYVISCQISAIGRFFAVDAGSSGAVCGGGGGGGDSALANESASLTNNILSAGKLRQHRSLQHFSRATAKYTSTSTDKKKDTVKLCFFKLRLRGIANAKQSPHLAMPLVDSNHVANDAGGEVCDHYSEASADKESTYTFSRHAIRSNYMDKSIEAKKKVPFIPLDLILLK
ncbi:uncharacterized protein LOC120350275 [Nilaparvata lugens]|uniref:uncharacterized protein LOC120350275 n=1 Tax=Nilaparvata lugens TaxID=108931 RepID=UPI00193D27FC|nr:uncharacterized protein LOC120350275 [Nilaparvata lugens]